MSLLLLFGGAPPPVGVNGDASDTASATDAVGASVILPALSDTGTATDNVLWALGLTVGDTATGTDTLGVGVMGPVSDTAAAVDSLLAGLGLTVTDTGSATDLASDGSVTVRPRFHHMDG